MTAHTIWNQATAGISTASVGGTNFELGLEFQLSSDLALTGVWWWTGSSSDVLPTQTGVYDSATQAPISGAVDSSPAWSGAPGSGWVKNTNYNGSITLTAGVKYVVGVWMVGTLGEFAGLLSNPNPNVVNGPITVFATQNSTRGNGLFSTTQGCPNNDSTGNGYTLDVEASTIVAPVSSSGATTLSLAMAGTGAVIPPDPTSGAVKLGLAMAGTGAVIPPDPSAGAVRLGLAMAGQAFVAPPITAAGGLALSSLAMAGAGIAAQPVTPGVVAAVNAAPQAAGTNQANGSVTTGNRL